MKIGVFTVLFANIPFPEMLQKVKSYGLEAVEIGCGGYPGKAHCDPAELLANPGKLDTWRSQLRDSGLELSALSCHGNPLHPQPEIARRFHEDWRQAVLLAEKLGVKTIVGFSGCPGDSDQARQPNWVTCAWPPDYLQVLEWQWNEKLIPYWQAEAKFAADHGVERIAFEMHPGFCVYNPYTLLKLREAVGPIIGANIDPSHLFWQGVDVVAAIRKLGEAGAIYHFHAKDTYVDPYNTAVDGTLDARPYQDIIHRSWTFRTVGYGHGTKVWRDIVSALRTVGYDGVLSIEHEDAMASIEEGFRKAVEVLREAVLAEPPAKPWWT